MRSHRGYDEDGGVGDGRNERLPCSAESAAPFSAGSSASASTSSASCCSLAAASSSGFPAAFFSALAFLPFDAGGAAVEGAASVLAFLPRLFTGASVAGAGAALRFGRPPASGEDSAGTAGGACSSAGRARLVDGRRGDESSLSSILSFRASSTTGGRWCDESASRRTRSAENDRGMGRAGTGRTVCCLHCAKELKHALALALAGVRAKVTADSTEGVCLELIPWNLG
ncbi:hypothetical protein EDB83DRAFT_461935 [Lactarius deliciosus]|nr:hypothetical protein EDB83DRAFT_461935 [Lactarius deliciosus]